MKSRSSLPLIIVVLILIAVPVLELWLLIQVGRAIGVLPTLAILVVEALFGAWLTRREGRSAWRALNASLASGRAPARELTDAALVLVGGVLLIFPGFITDVLGLICLVPFTRRLARWVLGLLVARRLTRRGVTLIDPRGRPGSGMGGDVIEGEVIEGDVVEDVRSGASSNRSAQDPDAGLRPEPLVIEGEVRRP